MAVGFQQEMNESLARIESIFMPGRLGDRRDEMRRLRESGDTMLFSGGVRWRVLLADYDKELEGESESLDAAFGDMANCLSFLAGDHGEDAEVICAVEPAPE